MKKKNMLWMPLYSAAGRYAARGNSAPTIPPVKGVGKEIVSDFSGIVVGTHPRHSLRERKPD